MKKIGLSILCGAFALVTIAQNVLTIEDEKISLEEFKAVFYKNNNNTALTKEYLDEYARVYPTGYNPQDSMGEYFYNEKDYKTAFVHYEKALDQYPMANSAINKVKELKEKLGKK